MYSLKKHTVKGFIMSCLAAVMCISVSACGAEQKPETSQQQDFANGAGLADLVPEQVALVIGGEGVKGAKGYRENVYYLCEDEMKEYISNPESLPAQLGGKDAWKENQLYSSYDNHGHAEYRYRCHSGIDVKTALQALGVDTSMPIAVEAKSTDGYSKINNDAFCLETKRYYFDPSGNAVNEVLPMLAYYESISLAGALDASTVVPTAVEDEGKTHPTFVFGQTAHDESNNCSFIMDTVKLRAGMDSPAFTLNTQKGAKSISISDLVTFGVYRSSYKFTAKGEHTHDVQGIPLTVLLNHWGIDVAQPAILQLFSAGSETPVRTLTAEEISRAFVAFSSKENGEQVANETSIMLYCPGSTQEEVVVPNFISATLA